MTEPRGIGPGGEWERLRALAEPLHYKVFRGSFSQAADPDLRGRPDAWFIAFVSPVGDVQAIVFSGDTPEAATFLRLAAQGARLDELADLAAEAVGGEPREALENLLDDVREVRLAPSWSDLAISVQGLRQALTDTLATAITAHGRLGSRLGQELRALEGFAGVRREQAAVRRLLRGPSAGGIDP